LYDVLDALEARIAANEAELSGMKTEILAAIAALAVLIVALGVAVGLITAKLPTNYIMGSSRQGNIDTAIDANFVTLAAAMDANFADVPTTEEIRIEMDANSTDFNTLVSYAQEWDPNFTLIKAMTDLIAIVTTTVADSNDANSFTLTAGLDVNDIYWLNVIMVEDADDSHREIRYIEEWLSTRVLMVDEPFGFTPDVGDNVWIMGTSYGGYLYDILYRVKLSSIPLYHFDNTAGGSGGTSGQGGTTIYGGDGTDP